MLDEKKYEEIFKRAADSVMSDSVSYFEKHKTCFIIHGIVAVVMFVLGAIAF